MVIHVKKTIMYFLIFVVLFQDSIERLLGLKIISYLDEFIVLMVAVRAIISVFNDRNISEEATSLLIKTFAFWVIGFVSCLIYSQYDYFSLIMGSILMIKSYILIASIIIKPIAGIYQYYLINAVLFYGKVSLVGGIINFLVPGVWAAVIPFAYEYTRHGFPSVMGFFIHSGQYGWFMLFVAILYYSAYKTGNNRKDFYRFIIYVLAACTSMKMKVLIGIIGIILADRYIVESKKLNINGIVITTVSTSILLYAFWDVLIETYQMYFTSQYETARYVFLVNSIKILMDYFPIGVGFSKFASYYARVNYSEYYYKYGMSHVYGLQPGMVFFGTDTFWPMIFGETGFLGTFFYISILREIYSLLRRSIKAVKYYTSRSAVILSYVAFFALIQSLLESLGEPSFNSSPQNIMLGMVIGISISNCLMLKRSGSVS